MTKKEIEILDDQIQYLCKNYQDRIKIMRQTLGINTAFTFMREVEIIESLYKSVLEHRKSEKATYFSCGTSGWHITYLRNKKTYKDGEKFVIKICFSFVETDTYE
jgi:hypothetical protein